MYDVVFTLANLFVLPFWALMIFVPGWSWTKRISSSLWTFTPLAVAYTLLLLLTIVLSTPGAPSISLAELGTPLGIAKLLSTPEAATVGWIHYLAFDLFVGRWAYLDSRERRLHPLPVSVALACTLLAGPFGLMLYLAVRAWDFRTRPASS